MTITAVDVAESFGLFESELMRQALVSFLQEQRRQVLAEQFEVLACYRVDTFPNFAAKITNGDVAEHPGWEDLITAENLSMRLEKIDAFLGSS